MITFDEFKKIDFRIGKVITVNKGKMQISLGDKDYDIISNPRITKDDKIVVIVNGDNLIIPLVNGEVPIIPEKDIKEGSRVR